MRHPPAPLLSPMRSIAALAVGLVLILLWEATGWDLPLTRAFGDSHGFAWRDAWLTRTVLHDMARAAGLAVLAVVAWDAWRPLWPGPSKSARRYWLAVIVISAVAVSAIKRVTLTSCPWELADFGGVAHYVPHWLPGLRDGGSGHCFPSGHATTAFAFVGLVFLWQPHAPAAARRVGWAILAFGAIFALGQLARGAHHLSHSLWSAWLCGAIAVAARFGAPGTAPVPVPVRSHSP